MCPWVMRLLSQWHLRNNLGMDPRLMKSSPLVIHMRWLAVCKKVVFLVVLVWNQLHVKCVKCGAMAEFAPVCASSVQVTELSVGERSVPGVFVKQRTFTNTQLLWMTLCLIHVNIPDLWLYGPVQTGMGSGYDTSPWKLYWTSTKKKVIFLHINVTYTTYIIVYDKRILNGKLGFAKLSLHTWLESYILSVTVFLLILL